MSDPVLDIRQVSRLYGERLALDEASLQLRAGRIACLLGPSGCGKSTLLRLIAGLEPADRGEIAIGGATVSANGEAVPPEDRGVGLVFQDCALFPHLSVADNVAFGLTYLRRADRRARVEELLAGFHVGHLADAWPHMLSGGEPQRVAIARAMAREPAILLLDEPLSSLDDQVRATVRRSVLADLRAAGMTVLIVTDDPAEAMQVADDLVLMSGGRIVQQGSPLDCYRHPASLAAARLLGEVTVLPAFVRKEIASTPFGDLPAPGFPNGAAQVAVRPEGLRISSDGWAATVKAVAFAGSFYTVDIDADGETASLKLTGAPPQPGSTVGVALDPALATVLASET